LQAAHTPITDTPPVLIIDGATGRELWCQGVLAAQQQELPQAQLHRWMVHTVRGFEVSLRPAS
jgi:hypothetical protein